MAIHFVSSLFARRQYYSKKACVWVLCVCEFLILIWWIRFLSQREGIFKIFIDINKLL